MSILDFRNQILHMGAMQLTQHTDFGLRLLIVLARREGGPVSLPSFAADQGLSYNHIAKVAQALVRAGFITTHRGRSGGVSLARPAATITLGEVVRSMEPNLRLADCANCALRSDCQTSSFLAEALGAFLAVLDRKTLSEVAQSGSPAFQPWAVAQPPADAGRDQPGKCEPASRPERP
jgi:Rrf2 family nitric oxide-sensitive transcriptional repressor